VIPAADLVRQWPESGPLLLVPGPPWRFFSLPSGGLCGTRLRSADYGEVFYTRAGMCSVIRYPLERRWHRPVLSVRFTGPTAVGVAILLLPPEREPTLGRQRTAVRELTIMRTAATARETT